MNTNHHLQQCSLCINNVMNSVAEGQPVINLLIIDDSLLIISKMMELFEDVENIYCIKSCSTYAETIDLLLFYSPAVVLLDINLPDKSGMVLLKYIKAFYPSTLVIMITNQYNDYYKKYCLQMGAYSYLDKSNDFDKLPLLINSVTGRG